ncbi:hypothetical protein PRVXH_002153 [Proteinivorax hydrogeniformans]|uniref:Uncharacterized protein n=1 Tax=Proteinivorax hydrogeniformans TaxID=1826727 RepID=A0AAU8HT83_9FIRM
MITKSRLYFRELWVIFIPVWLGLLGTVGLILGISSIEPILFVPYIVLITLMTIKESELVFYMDIDLIRVLPIEKKQVSLTIVLTFLISLFLGGAVNVLNYVIALHSGFVEEAFLIWWFLGVALPLVMCGTFVVLPNAIFNIRVIWKNILSYILVFVGVTLGIIMHLFLPLVVVLPLSTICYLAAFYTVIKAYKTITLQLKYPEE